ncbi:hypothetical protein EDD16DRAFT_1610607 [Pisolithus croceorrhizus]|nr:hypothetical protein EDD16DRAFT_1610607 [Pisolithus croceorrhizus]
MCVSVSVRGNTRECNMSPISPSSCRAVVYHTPTPPRLSAADPSNSPMLTPSLPPLFSATRDNDNVFLQSPFKSPRPVYTLYPHRTCKQPHPPIDAGDDDEGSIFLSSSAAPSPFFPAPSSHPLRTPVKEVPPVSRSVLKTKALNVQPAASTSQPSAARARLGTKRKSSGQLGGFSTPPRNPVSTPLSISAAKADPTSGIAFHRLAPLPAPRFGNRTPQSKAETDAYVKKQAETMKRLRIRDMDNSDEDWGVIESGDSDSGCDGRGAGKNLFSYRLRALTQRTKSQSRSPKKQLLVDAVPQKGNATDEVTEAISPGGHIIKRRARSRPVSQELLESVNHSSSPPTLVQSDKLHTTPPEPPPVAFPSVARSRLSTAVSPTRGSPRARRRVTGSNGPTPFHRPRTSDSSASRVPANRPASGSSASLFFGPSIPLTKTRTRTSTTATNSASAAADARLRVQRIQPSTSNRHSYAGPGSTTMTPLPWKLRSTRHVPSPDSSPLPLPTSAHSPADDDDDDMFFEPCGPPESSFVFSVTEETPSPRSQKGKGMLPLKYKPRDSGVALSDDEDVAHSSNAFLSAMPRPSTSTSSLYSDAGEDLITPIMPNSSSGWPNTVVIGGLEDNDRNYDGLDVDAFIMRTLTAAPKLSADETKRPPGTPVKKAKTSYLGGNRPWQSAVANKVGFNFDFETDPGGHSAQGGGCKSKNKPRKSLPAAFPNFGGGSLVGMKGKAMLNVSDSEDDEESNSPSSRKEHMYDGLGLGRPSAADRGPLGAVSRTRWLMRRSSSGAFSSGSETSVGTPTRRTKDWPLPLRPALQGHISAPSDKTESRSSSNKTSTSPTLSRHKAQSSAQRVVSPLVKTDDECVGTGKRTRFEWDFVEVDEIGSGEFGKVMKVRAKNGPENQVWAVKKSKPFEGPRHRLRLREEVDILQHLSQAAVADPQGYANVLAYIDSWEEDDMLFMQTELCELGNFARFLWEYGKAFQRLDEARVWKIFADLSNGLRFIHNAGVIHLDLKPANVFLTGEGRFKIGDFGMASLWPRRSGGSPMGVGVGGFEREGDKVYLAREVLQGTYGKAADVFSFGMMMLETATNIVVPDQGEGWHRLRQEDFSQIDLSGLSAELTELIRSMMRMDPGKRVDVQMVYDHPVVARARTAMERARSEALARGESTFAASPLAGVGEGFLDEILMGEAMDMS